MVGNTMITTIRTFLDGLDIRYHIEYPKNGSGNHIRSPRHAF